MVKYIKKIMRRFINSIYVKRFISFIFVFFYSCRKPLFQYIEIETVNRCNGKCSFCPVNVYNEVRPYAKMDTAVFKKIIDELSEMNYEGLVALFSNNEPFIDTRIVEFAKYARNNLKQAYIYLYTNGSLLTVEKLEEIIPYINYIHIDNYNDVGEINSNISQVLNDFERKNGANEKIRLVKRKETEILTSRGGIAPNKREAKGVDCRCIFPFLQMVIRPDGKASLCCNDAYGQWTMGDVTKDSLKDIWYGKRYSFLRRKMRVEGRKAIAPCCDSCDTINLRMIYRWKYPSTIVQTDEST